MTLTESQHGAISAPETKDAPTTPVEIITPEGDILTEKLRVRLTKYGSAVVGTLRVIQNHSHYTMEIELPKHPGKKPERIGVTSGNFAVILGQEVSTKHVTCDKVIDGENGEELILLRAKEPDERFTHLGYYEL